MVEIYINDTRYYVTDQILYPSVTSLLSFYEDKSGLDKWRNRIGIEEAKKITEDSIVRGKNIHSEIENYLLDNIDPVLPASCNAVDTFYSNVQSVKVEHFVKNVEDNLWYAGRIDAIVQVSSDSFVTEYNDSLPEGEYIVDLKTKRKLPYDCKYMLKNMLQLSAYYNIVNTVKGAILVYTTDKMAQCYYLSKESLEYLYKNIYLKFLLDYYSIEPLETTWNNIQENIPLVIFPIKICGVY